MTNPAERVMDGDASLRQPSLGGWLLHVMRRAGGALSLEESLHVIMDSMKTYFPCQSVAVILIDEDTKELRIKISRQISYTFVKEFCRSGPSATVERIVLEQKPLLLNDLRRDSAAYNDLKLEHDFTSAVLAPVVKNQRSSGYIFCDRADKGQFTESDLLHLQVIGLLIGSMMDKFDLVKQSKQLSLLDDASQALQYRSFIPMVATEIQRAQLHSYEVSLALVAVNGFRMYIDTFGIDAAHALLAEVVTITKGLIRDVDILARFGADELILCLAGTNRSEADRKLREIQAAVSSTAVGRGNAPVTLTIGGLTLSGPEALHASLQDILAALGKGLLEAKTHGAGHLCVHSLEPSWRRPQTA